MRFLSPNLLFTGQSVVEQPRGPGARGPDRSGGFCGALVTNVPLRMGLAKVLFLASLVAFWPLPTKVVYTLWPVNKKFGDKKRIYRIPISYLATIGSGISGEIV